MRLTISLTEKEGIPIVELIGRLVLGKECDALRNQIKQLLAADKTEIILNLENVSFCDSPGLGCLVNALVSSRNRGGAVRLVSPSKRVRALLQVTKLTTVFEIHADAGEALASFK